MTTVVIVGGSLTGMAAAARLAKAGHRVVLLERQDRLGGRGAAALAATITLPAAWRDLFKKSGRPLEAELARRRLQLVPAPPATHSLPDGSTLTLPTDRGGQWATLSAAYGPGVAARWRDLLDELDHSWQLLRRIGLESEFSGRGQLSRTTLAALRPRVSVEDLARRLDHPHLGELVRSVARNLGSEPRRTPGWCAARLSVERTFGRWVITDSDGLTQPTSRLVELLVDRLDLRGVERHLTTTVTQIRPGAVTTDHGTWAADRIIVALNPWAHAALVGRSDRVIERAARRLRPVDSTSQGGAQWRSWRTLLDLPPLVTGLPGILAASSCSPGGPDPWARLLTGALATYRVHRELTGQDIRPANKALGRQDRTVISTSTNMSDEREPE